MKKIRILFLMIGALISLTACAGNPASREMQNQEPKSRETDEVQEKSVQEEADMNTEIMVAVNDRQFKAELNDSEAARQFYQMLPLSVDMKELNGNEKYYIFPKGLEAHDENVESIETGDIMLYSADYLVLFYEDFKTSYAYTPLGKITDVDGLQEAVGSGDVTITFRTGEMSEQVSTDELSGFDFETKTVLLNSGYEMPIAGLGTYSLQDETCVNSVVSELKNGGRLIDTAYMYHNEESVGKGIRESNVPREEVFVTTKLYPNQYADAESAIDEALKKLDVDYIDLMLLHHPGTGDVEAYHVMEKAVEQGKIRSIGLSNWYIEELGEFLPQVTITPAVVQNEIHPYYQENEVIDYIHSLGIVAEGWYPLGGRGHTAELLGDSVITTIADAHQVSAAQVILRWNLQKGVVVIPGSSNPEHIKENLDLFDFELTEDEMKKMNSLNRNEKHDWY